MVANSSQEARRIPQGIWVLGFVSLLMDVSSEMIHSLLPVFLLVGLGTSALTIGLIEGVAESTALIVKVFSGTLSDYLGRRKTLAVIGYGIGAASKPLFAVATTVGMVFTARFADRIGKGIRGAPRDALIADLAPSQARGAAYGLRQALDTLGAFIGPLLAMGLMLLWSNDFRAVFWVAVIPGILAVVLLMIGVREPKRTVREQRTNPIHWREIRRLSPAFWWVAVVGAAFSLARFSEAFLVLRAQQAGLPLAAVPLVLILMNLVYAASAYPFGKLSDGASHRRLLMLGLGVLVGANCVLAFADSWQALTPGIALWGLHLGITQGLLARMVADTAAADLRGTAFAFFNLLCGFALLVASALAGLLWDQLGASAPFYAGALIGLLTLALVALGRARDRVPAQGDPEA
jgi:MFS family permease